MAWHLQTIFLVVGTFLVIGESSGGSRSQGQLNKWKAKAQPIQTTCYGFPGGLSEESDVVIGWSSKWKNECPEGNVIRAFWTTNANDTFKDMKCCAASVDHVLSEMIFGLEQKSDGPSDVNKTWIAQCSANYALIGVKIVKGGSAGPKVAGMKCSAIINEKINYKKCSRIDFAAASGKTRDPNLEWSHECPSGMVFVGLHGRNGFSVISYGKCCSTEGIPRINVLPMSCNVNPGDMCGWSTAKNSQIPWQFRRIGAAKYFIWLQPGPSSGSATLTSPGYSFIGNQVCFRLKYRLYLFAAIRIYKKSYSPNDKVAFVKQIEVLTQNEQISTKKDVKIDISSNFQIIVEGVRLKGPISNAIIEGFEFLEIDRCQADECSHAKGCENGICLPSGLHGLLKCKCNSGYQNVNGVCRKSLPPTNIVTSTKRMTGTTKATVRTVTDDGQHRGGDGGGKGGTDEKTNGNKDSNPSQSKLKKKITDAEINPWMYTVIGAVCGVLLVLFLVFSFLTYRKRRLTRRTYQFNFDVNYLRARSFSDGSFGSGNNNSYVPEPTSPIHETEICEPALAEIHQIPRIEIPADECSTHTATPPTHHYFEVEPEAELERKVSQITLASPVYGSNEDISEQSHDQEVFLEPPSDERELCAQLDREIDWRDITIMHERQLGQGAFGYVHFGIWNASDGARKNVAIKSMKDSNSAEERIKFLQEAAIMKQFAHQNVMFMFGVVTKRYPPMIILEYMKNGNLRKYLKREGRLRIKRGLQRSDYELHTQFLKMAREIAAGMTYLSGMQFVHRDLAARNILLDENMVCKIGDFGLARDLIGCQHYIARGGQIPVKWTAPEALSFRRYSSASDVWSYGVLLYEIWSLGRKPYEGLSNDDVIEHVCNKGYRMPPPKDCPRVIYHLMIDCWHPEESKRPRFSQIKFCLALKDERLLGRQTERRQRSVTLNEISENTIREEEYKELQYVYCKTE